jgi:ketosteroid isomerase-like protein
MSNAERLLEALASVFADDETEIDAALIDRMIEALRPITAPDVVMIMRGSDDTFVGTYEGFDGLRQGWEDWLESFERVRFQVEDVEQIGDNVLTLGHQVGTTQGVELEQPSAALWKFREGLLGRVEFHLDRDVARSSAEEQLA